MINQGDPGNTLKKPRGKIIPGGVFLPRVSDTIQPTFVTTDSNTKKPKNTGVPIIVPNISALSKLRWNTNAVGLVPSNQTKENILQKGTRVWIRIPLIFNAADYNIIPNSTFEKIVYGNKFFLKPVYYFGPSSKFKGFSIFTTRRNSVRGSKILTNFLIPVKSNPTIISRKKKLGSDFPDDGSDFPDDGSDNADIPDDEGDVNVNRKYNLVFDMLDMNHGYAARIGREDDCFIEYELARRVLSIHYFICLGGGKQLLADLLDALDIKVSIVKLTAASIDSDKQKLEGKPIENLYKNYRAMGFSYIGNKEFIAKKADIRAAYEDKQTDFEPSDEVKEDEEDEADLASFLRDLNPQDDDLDPQDYDSELDDDDLDPQDYDSEPELINVEPESSTEQEVKDFIRARFTEPISEITFVKENGYYKAYRPEIHEKPCYIKFELLHNKLEIKAFICEKGGKELLRDTMIQLLLQNENDWFGLVVLDAVDLRRKPLVTNDNRQYFINKEYIDEADLFTQRYDDEMQELVNRIYRSMGFIETTKDHFMGSTLGILNTLLAFKRQPGGSRRQTKKTKRRQTKKRKRRQTKKRKRRKTKRRQTKKRGKR
jgi:hypothetical protein